MDHAAGDFFLADRGLRGSLGVEVTAFVVSS